MRTAQQACPSDAVSGQDTFTETDASTYDEHDTGSYTFAEQGTFGGQSYSFPTVVYQEQGSALATATAASTVVSSGRSVETAVSQGGQTVTISFTFASGTTSCTAGSNPSRAMVTRTGA